MEAMQVMMKLLVVALMVVALMMASSVDKVAAADAPTPAPTSDAASVFVPTIFASLIAALAFGFLF